MTERGSYSARPPLTRMAIIAAGPVTNLLLALLIFASLLAARGKPSFLPVASAVVPHSAADTAGFRPGDRILAVNERTMKVVDELRPTLWASGNQILSFEILRSGQLFELRPRLSTIKIEGKSVEFLGIQTKERTFVTLSIVQVGVETTRRTWSAVTDTVHGISDAVTTGQGTQNFAGILGVAQFAGQAAVTGDTSMFDLIAILSVSLALMNLLPIPVLDGGAMLFCAAEWIRGHPASLMLQSVVTHIGVAAMATLFMLSMMHDSVGFGLLR